MITELFAILVAIHVIDRFLNVCQKAVNLRESIDRLHRS